MQVSSSPLPPIPAFPSLDSRSIVDSRIVRFLMSRSRVVPICLLTSAALLFLYTFTERETPPTSHLRPTGLPPIVSRRPFNGSKSSTVDARLTTFFQQQAVKRKSLFETAFQTSHPVLTDVFLYIVPEVYCPLLVRVGSVEDGGKWVCNPWALHKGGVVFSLGSRNDISFEKDLQRITGGAARIVTVDMNPVRKGTLAGLSAINAQFVHAMMAPKTDLNAVIPQYTVVDLMTSKMITQIEFLKMDIEGSENSVLPQFLASDSVCQIMVEIHSIEDTPTLLRDVANAGFLLMKYEVNPYGASKGISEYSFIHESCLAKYGATLLASYLKQ